MRRLASAVALASVLAACTHQRPLHAVSEVRGDVTIVTVDGRAHVATMEETAIGPVFRTTRGDVIDPSAIVRVTDQRRLRGAGEGLGLGAGAGVLIGVALGFLDGDDPPCEECWFNNTAGEKAVIGGVLLGVVGAVVGLAAGTILGSHFVYEHERPPVITPVGPPGSVAGFTLSF